jgi:hypothetical protein
MEGTKGGEFHSVRLRVWNSTRSRRRSIQYLPTIIRPGTLVAFAGMTSSGYTVFGMGHGHASRGDGNQQSPVPVIVRGVSRAGIRRQT